MNNNIKRFLSGCESNNTKISYESDLNQFFDFINKEDKDVNFGDIHDWKAEMLSRGYSSATICRKLTSLRTFYDFLHSLNIVEINPLSSIKTPTIKNKKRDYIPMEEAVDLLKVAKNPRDKAIIAIYLSTGLRVSELINLTLEQYYNENINIKIKGDRERTIYLTNECREIVDEYIKVRKISNISNLFVSNQGTPMRADCISKMLRKVAEIAGVQEHISNHSLRHSYISKVCDEYGINIAKDVIGHSDISTTQRYAHNKQETIKNIMLNIKLA